MITKQKYEEAINKLKIFLEGESTYVPSLVELDKSVKDIENYVDKLEDRLANKVKK